MGPFHVRPVATTPKIVARTSRRKLWMWSVQAQKLVEFEHTTSSNVRQRNENCRLDFGGNCACRRPWYRASHLAARRQLRTAQLITLWPIRLRRDLWGGESRLGATGTQNHRAKFVQGGHRHRRQNGVFNAVARLLALYGHIYRHLYRHVYPHVYPHVVRHVYKYVYRPVHGHAYRYVYGHAYIHICIGMCMGK